MSELTLMESLLVDIFKNYFEVEDIDINANFFDFGINSIELGNICKNLSVKMKKKIDLLLFFEFPSIYLLSKELERKNRGGKNK